MEKLSPRSYVTGGFDIIKPPLKILEKNLLYYFMDKNGTSHNKRYMLGSCLRSNKKDS
ncbi:MAG: hypothetical protein FWH19_01465 [Treponema sp.]|nr:hypothetical protein [Treponema sp.]